MAAVEKWRMLKIISVGKWMRNDVLLGARSAVLLSGRSPVCCKAQNQVLANERFLAVSDQ